MPRIPAVRFRLVVAAALLVALAVPAAALARSGKTAFPPYKVVATGLDNPRGIVFGPLDWLYVAEAGRGGPDCSLAGCLGLTSRITRIDPHTGLKQTLVSGLFSAAAPDGSFAVGADGISVQVPGGGGLYAQMALNPNAFEQPPPETPTAKQPTGDPILDAAIAQAGKLLRVTGRETWQAVADVGAFDYDWTATTGLQLDPQNPEFPDANPYGVLSTPSGVYVVDGGSNTLDLYQPWNGSLSVLQWIPNPPVGGDIYDAVPTCVAARAPGIVVGDLNGRLWSYQGGVLSQIPLSGAPVVSIGGCASDSRYVYLVDIFAGNVLAVDPAGNVSVIASGLTLPGGIAVGPNHTLYVTNFSTFPGLGQVVRIPAPGF